MALILNGRIVRDQIAAKLKEKIIKLGVKPTLLIIQVGTRPESSQYIKQKIKLGETIGVAVKHLVFPELVSIFELTKKIDESNRDKSIQGIIVQLPLPAHLNKDEIINQINPSKDVDGLTKVNVEKLVQNDPTGLVPATARGVVTLLKAYQIPIASKRVTIIGRSDLVGKPLTKLLTNLGANVSIGHRQTEDLPALARTADILIVAAGSPKLVTKDFVQSGQVVVDIGTTLVEGKLVGDVDFGTVAPIVAAISPVPGGVGPMTAVSLFENLFQTTML